jgi:hypothetical protein
MRLPHPCRVLCDRVGTTPVLSLRLPARHLLDFAFLRSASVLAGLQRMLGLALFAGCAFCFFAFIFAKCGCISHEVLLCNLVIGKPTNSPITNYQICPCAVPTGLGYFGRYPGLTPWANYIPLLRSWSRATRWNRVIPLELCHAEGPALTESCADTALNPIAKAGPKSAQPTAKTKSHELGLLQLRVLFHQLLQAEARELYRNLGLFAVAFALIDRALSIFRMLDFLSRAKSAAAFWCLNRQLW